MKRWTLIPILLGMAVVLLPMSACSRPAGDPFDPTAAVPTRAPTDWYAFNQDFGAVDVKPVGLSKIPATKLDLPDDYQAGFQEPLSDGGCITAAFVPVDAADTSYEKGSYLRLVRFGRDGRRAWDRKLDSEAFHGYVVGLCVFGDDGFAVAVRTAKDTSGTDTVDRLLRFSSSGQPQWDTKVGVFVAGALEKVFATPDGAVLGAGTIPSTDGGEPVDNDVALNRIEKDGTVSKQVVLGNRGYEYLMDASYAAPLGLVVAWRTEDFSSAGDGSAFSTFSRVAGFDDSLEQIWSRDIDQKTSLFEVQVLAGGQGTYLLGSTRLEILPDQTSGASFDFVDPDGETVWSYSLELPQSWVRGAVRLTDGRTVLGISQPSEESLQETTLLTVFSTTGGIVGQIPAPPGGIRWVKETRDGGFTVCTVQTLKGLPQPPYVSSMWTDSEAVVAHYDADLKLVWMRSIDQYKDSLQNDRILATVDDRLLVS
jgi:hypothetical protein